MKTNMQSNKKGLRIQFGLKQGGLIFLFLGLMAQLASAATYTWVGASAGWQTASNWAPSSVPPTSNSSTTILFNSASGTTSTNNFSTIFTLNGFDLEGTSLNTTTIGTPNAALNFMTNGSTNPSIVQNSSGSYLLQGNGGITLSNNVTLSGTGTGLITVAAIVSGTGGLIVNSSTSALTLTGVNTYSGGTVVNSGVLRLGVTTNKVIGTGTLTLNGGKVSSLSTSAVLALSNSVTSGTGSMITLGDAVNTGSMTFSGSTTLSVGTTLIAASNVKFTGSVALGNNVTLAPTNNATLTLSSMDISNNVAVKLTLGQAPLAITGALSDLNLAGKLSFVLTGGTTGTPYTLVTFGSADSSFTYADLNLISSDYALDTSFGNGGWRINGTSLQVQFVPEPSTTTMLALGVIGIGFTAVRYRKSSLLS